MVTEQELVPRDLHFNAQLAESLIENALATPRKPLYELMDKDTRAYCWQGLYDCASRIREILERNDRFVSTDLMRAVDKARQKMLRAGVSSLFCRTDRQVLDLLNTLYD